MLDTGITPHSDLNANILPGYDFIEDPEVSVDGDGRERDFDTPGELSELGDVDLGDSAP